MVAFIEKKRSSVNDKSNLTDYDLIKTIFDFMISDSKTRPKLENNVLKKECIEVFTKEDSSKDAINYLSNLKYLQQINRKLLKWKEKNLDFTYNTYFNDMSTNYRTTMSKNREDLIVDLGTYSKIILPFLFSLQKIVGGREIRGEAAEMFKRRLIQFSLLEENSEVQ